MQMDSFTRLEHTVMMPLLSHVPVLLEGEPGGGKSSFTRRLAEKLNVLHIDVNLSQNEGVDVHGCRIVARESRDVNGKPCTVTVQAPPDYAIEAVSAPQGALINFEELTCVPPPEAGPTLGIFSDHKIAGIALDKTRIGIIACCNPPKLSAGGWKLSLPSINRFCRISFRQSPHEWAEQFVTYWGNPPTIERWGVALSEEEWSQDRAVVANFVLQHPEVVNQLPQPGQKSINGMAEECFCSYRSLDYASRIMTHCRLFHMSDDTRYELWAGLITAAAALQLSNYTLNMSLPRPSDLIDDPSIYPLDLPSDRVFTVLMSCVAEFYNRHRTYKEQGGSKNKKVRDKLLRSLTNCFKIAGIVLRNGGPKDIVAKMARLLVDESVYPQGFDPPEEIVEIIKVVKAAGVNWRRDRRPVE